MNNISKTNKKKTTSIILQSILVISAITIGGMMISNIPEAEAYQCTSQHSGSKCYATHQFDPTSYFHGLKATSDVKYTDGDDGYVVYSHWIELSDGDIIEVAWIDTVDDNNNPTFACGHNGVPVDTWGSPSDNTSYLFEVEDIDKDTVWEMRANGTTDTNCDYDADTYNGIDSQVGYELSHNNEVDVENAESDNIQFWDNGYWFYWQSSYGVHGKFLQPSGYTPPHFVDYCGSGMENYYHSEHGYGSDPGTC